MIISDSQPVRACETFRNYFQSYQLKSLKNVKISAIIAKKKLRKSGEAEIFSMEAENFDRLTLKSLLIINIMLTPTMQCRTLDSSLECCHKSSVCTSGLAARDEREKNLEAD